jgi:DNA-binding MarR family transcriptional regulator
MDASEQLYVALQHAARELRVLDEEIGVSPSRFSILATLRYDGSKRLGELARREGVAQPTMTEAIRRLEQDGLVVRRTSPGDGRGCVVDLTPAGRSLVRRARARKIRWVSQALAAMPDDAIRSLHLAAEALDRHALQQD